MTNTLSTAMPAGILGGLAAAMLIFIWWWFPRTYRRGIAKDTTELDGPDAQANREMVVQNARNIVENYRETLKQRELAKKEGAPSKNGVDIEAQNSMPTGAPDLLPTPQTAYIQVAPIKATDPMKD